MIETAADLAPSLFDRAAIGLAEECLELGEQHFNRVQVGAVWRQEQEVFSRGTDCLPGSVALVAAEIVEDHHVTGPQGRHEALLHPGGEQVAIDRAIGYAGRDHLAPGQACDEGQRAPAPVGNFGQERSAALAPASQTARVRTDPGFVQGKRGAPDQSCADGLAISGRATCDPTKSCSDTRS